MSDNKITHIVTDFTKNAYYIKGRQYNFFSFEYRTTRNLFDGGIDILIEFCRITVIVRKGGELMENLITMTSITYAMKAKNMLNYNGVYCEVVRTPAGVGSGCGYSIKIKDDPEKIAKMLEYHNIKYKQIIKN